MRTHGMPAVARGICLAVSIVALAATAACGTGTGASSPDATPSAQGAVKTTVRAPWINPTSIAKPPKPSALNSAAKYKYSIFAVNDLGMHCIQGDYSGFLILPPGNNLKVQVFKKGGEGARLVTSGIRVKYRVIGNTHSADKLNFWQYAADYGYNIKRNVGITGNKLSGRCVRAAGGKYWQATAIPLTPVSDNGSYQPYQVARITVTNRRGKVLAVQPKVVLPVSTEMHCDNCHGANVVQSVLQAHDSLSGTSLWADLQAGKRHACAECHQDNILGMAGKAGVLSLSQAMHGFHADKIDRSTVTLAEPCYNCHPGQLTKCLRGVMATAGLTCTSSGCHGSMSNVAATIAAGRQPWLQEPDCGNCHPNGANSGQLYRNSYLSDAPEGMSGRIQCEMCHNGTHSEWTSRLAVDNSIPRALQGKPGVIMRCTPCHKGHGKIHGNTGD
jgi:hypothetical protein